MGDKIEDSEPPHGDGGGHEIPGSDLQLLYIRDVEIPVLTKD